MAGRTSNKQKRMAELYVKGPEFLRGDWEKCAIAAGLDPTPATDEPHVCNAIRDLGGRVPGDAEPELDTGLGTQLDALSTAADAGIPWAQLRDDLTAVIRSVAKGDVRATAAQVSMLKHVIAEAKAEEAGGSDKARNVVILPTQGAGATLTFEQAARAQVAAIEAPADE
jgi:hypothetical protein